MPARGTEIPQGTLSLLVLRTLATGRLHGVGIADRLQQITRGVFSVGPGSLFPALHRLEEKDCIRGEWGELESGRRAKFYVLTKAGRARLAAETKDWNKATDAIYRVLAHEG